MALVSIPLDKIKKIDYIVIPNDKRKTLAQMFTYLDKKPDYLINGTLFNMGEGNTIVYSKDEKKKHGWMFSKQGIGIKGDKELVWTDINSAMNDSNGIRDFIGGCPTLVKDGKRFVDKGTTDSPYIMNRSHIRSFWGFDDTSLKLCASDSRNSIDNLVNYCLSNGFKYACNLDGGGSTVLGKKTNGVMKPLNKPSENRAVSNWIAVYLIEDKLTIPPVTANPQVKPTTIKVDGTNYTFNSVNKDGRTFVRLREFEQAGYKIDYVNNIPTINKPGTNRTATPTGKFDIMIDNKMYNIDKIVVDGSTYLKLRDFEQAGYSIGYSNGIATINKPR